MRLEEGSWGRRLEISFIEGVGNGGEWYGMGLGGYVVWGWKEGYCFGYWVVGDYCRSILSGLVGSLVIED